MLRRAYVLAGNFNEYLYWLKESNANRIEFPYISSIQTIFGIENITVIRTGTWWRRDDIEKIEQIIKIANIIQKDK